MENQLTGFKICGLPFIFKPGFRLHRESFLDKEALLKHIKDNYKYDVYIYLLLPSGNDFNVDDYSLVSNIQQQILEEGFVIDQLNWEGLTISMPVYWFRKWVENYA